MSRTQLLNPLATQQPHSSLSLSLENLKHPFHTSLATSSQSEKWRPTQTNSLGTQSQGFHNVCATLNAAIDPDFKLGQDFRAELADLEQSVESGWGGIEGATAVVGENDTLYVLRVVRGEVGVFVCLQSLQDNRQRCVFC